MVNSDGPPLAPESRKNMMTRPFGQNVGHSLWKPSVSSRSPEPSGLVTPMPNLPPPFLVKAMSSPRGDQPGVELETGACPCRGVAGRGIDRLRVGEARGLLGAPIHHEQVGIAALLQAHY